MEGIATGWLVGQAVGTSTFLAAVALILWALFRNGEL